MKPSRLKSTVRHAAVVRSWMKPHLDGRVSHRLYSTWAMVYHMEVAARKLLAPALEPEEEAVGGAVRVRHLAPARIGERLRIVCALARVRGNRVHTRLEVFVKNRKIGEGTHLQVVLPRRRFEALWRTR